MINANDKDRLEQKLLIAMQALTEIEDRASRLDTRVSKRRLSEHSAFNRLVGSIQATVKKTREEVDYD